MSSDMRVSAGVVADVGNPKNIGRPICGIKGLFWGMVTSVASDQLNLPGGAYALVDTYLKKWVFGDDLHLWKLEVDLTDPVDTISDVLIVATFLSSAYEVSVSRKDLTYKRSECLGAVKPSVAFYEGSIVNITYYA
jgi:hypothetical protein